MAAIRKKGNSIYLVYRMSSGPGKYTGKQIWEKCQNETEANLKKLEIEAQMLQGRAIVYSELTFREFVETKFIAVYAKKKWKYTTYDTNMGIIRNHLYPTFEHMKLRSITPFAVESFFSQITAKKITSPNKQLEEEDLRCISGRTANYIYSVFKCIMSKAVSWKELTESPVTCDKPAPDYEAEKRDAWAPEDFDLVLANIEHETLHLAVHFAFKTSMRIGEITGLTWDCIDFEQCSVSVTKQAQRVSRDSIETLSRKFVIQELHTECLHSKKKGEEKETVLILKHYPKNSRNHNLE